MLDYIPPHSSTLVKTFISKDLAMSITMSSYFILVTVLFQKPYKSLLKYLQLEFKWISKRDKIK